MRCRASGRLPPTRLAFVRCKCICVNADCSGWESRGQFQRVIKIPHDPKCPVQGPVFGLSLACSALRRWGSAQPHHHAKIFSKTRSLSLRHCVHGCTHAAFHSCKTKAYLFAEHTSRVLASSDHCEQNISWCVTSRRPCHGRIYAEQQKKEILSSSAGPTRPTQRPYSQDRSSAVRRPSPIAAPSCMMKSLAKRREMWSSPAPARMPESIYRL